MTKRENASWLRRMGSAFNIGPVNDYSEHMPQGNSEDRIRGHWTAAGGHLASAIDAKKGKPSEGKPQDREDYHG